MNKLILVFAALVLFGCGSGKSQESEADSMDRATRIKLEQYQVQGMGLYKKYCQSCHQANGEGLASLYPPLKGADYLLEDLPRAACTIKNGLVETITVNGTTYSQMMPGLQMLTDLEIAEILTYITNEWGNNAGLSGVKDVEKWLNECKN